MIIYPAIDLKDGKCVRLTKGNFNQETIYSRSPLEQAKVFEEMYKHSLTDQGLEQFNKDWKELNK